MNGLFGPASAVMSRLRYPQKFALITLLFALPLGVVLYFFLTEIGNDIAFSEKERRGGEYTRGLVRVLRELQDHKALTLGLLNGDASREPLRAARHAEIERRVQEMDDLDRALGRAMNSTGRWTAWKARWKELASSLPTIQKPGALTLYGDLAAEALSLIVHVADTSNLILDPDLDTYYLMDSTVNVLPELLHRLDDLRAQGLTTSADKVLSIEEQGAFGGASAVIRASLASHLRGMKTAFEQNPRLRESVGPEVDRFRDALAPFMAEIDSRVLKPERFTIPAGEFLARTSTLMADGYRLYDILASHLGRLLTVRVDRFETRRRLAVTVTVVMVFLVLYFYVGFYLSVRQTVNSLRAVSERLVAGEKSRTVTVPSRDELGEVTMAFNAVATALSQANASMHLEIEQRARAEETLRGSEERVRRIIESSLDAVVTIDDQGLVTEWSPQAERTFGWSREDVVGQRLSEYIIPARFRDAHEDGLRAFQKTGEGPVLNKRIEIVALHKSGREFPVEVAITPIRLGKTVIFSAFVRDITARNQAQHELRVAKDLAEQASRAKSQFLANMSHELRTPLNSVIGFANILLKKKDNAMPPLQISYLERILANGKHLLELINEVLDLSKIEAGKMELETAPTDIAALIRDTVGQMEGRVAGREIVLQAALPPSSAPLETDAGKLRQVLINLIGNALKFTEQGSVTVRLLADPSSGRPYRIEVVDTGIGIPKTRQTAIFEAFQQADNTTSRKYGGTGLGLTITRSLCQLMGYSIMVESEPGKGSTFSVLLGPAPVEPSPGRNTTAIVSRARQAPAEAAPRDLRSKVVLVIDDEADSRTLVSETLQEAGCTIIAADSGRRGLELACKHVPDLITLDLLMPDMAGWEVLRTLKATPSLKDIPVVVVSIIARESRGTLFGAIDTVTKPFSREEMLDALRRNLKDGKGRVLVVDDDEDARKIFCDYLSEEPVDVATAADGRAALEALESFPADLIVLDLMMPVMDGMQFLERLRLDPRYAHVPVVIVTARELSADTQVHLQLQSSAIVRKSAALESDLKGTLHALIRKILPQGDEAHA